MEWGENSLENCLSLYDSGVWGEEGILDDIPILRSTNIRNWLLDANNEIAYRKVAPRDITRCKLEYGDIIVTKSSGSPHLIGEAALFDLRTDRNYLFSNFLLRLRPNIKIVIPQYLFFFLKSPAARKVISDMSRTTSGLRNLQICPYKNQKIPLPFPNNPEKSLTAQRKIVARIEVLLSEVREMREINQRIIGDTQQLLGAFLFQIFENLPGKENKPIGEVAWVKGGKRQPKGESFATQPTPYPYLRVTDFRNFGIDESDLRYLTPEVHAQIRNYIISEQDVFISIAGTIGLVGTIPAHLSGSNLTENAAKIVFLPEYQDKIKNKYLMYYLASPHGKKQIEARTKAAGQPKLALERIKTITFPYNDSIPQQEAIIEKFEAMQSEVTEMLRTQQADEILINQLEESILSQAFLGKL